MKYVEKISDIIFIILAAIFFFYIAKQLTGDKVKIEDDEIVVSKNFIDSLAKVSQTPPDTIIKTDTIWKEKIVYLEKEPPVPIKIDRKVNYYEDSLVTEDMKVFVSDTIRGEILSRKWTYLPPPEIITEKIITKTKPVPVIEEKLIPHNGLYVGLQGGLWPEKSFFLYGDYMFNNKYQTGVSVGIVKDSPAVMLKFGIKL
jgi:hypothetical protein